MKKIMNKKYQDMTAERCQTWKHMLFKYPYRLIYSHDPNSTCVHVIHYTLSNEFGLKKHKYSC